MVNMDTELQGQTSRNELIASYKALLRDIIDRNPSGLRLRIANTLGTHRSFLSQLTNPSDPTPIPAKHLKTLFELCHFSTEEQKLFVSAYKKAHPKRVGRIAMPPGPKRETETLELQIPVLDDPARQRALVAHIRDVVKGFTDLLIR